MIIWIDDVIFSGTVAKIDCLALLRLTAMRRHTVYISTDPAITSHKLTQQIAPSFFSWQKDLSANLQTEVGQLLEKVAQASANAVARASAQRVLVSTQQWSINAPHFTIDVPTALHALAQPLFILVENQINDAAFLRTAMPPDWRTKLQKWEQNGQLRFYQGGGITEIINMIERFSQDKHALAAYGYPAQMWWHLHFIIYDHDGRSEDTPSANSRKIGQLLQEAGKAGHGHRLLRCSPEHYFPELAMNALLDAYRARSHVSDLDFARKNSDITTFYALASAKRFYAANVPAISGKSLKKGFFSALEKYGVTVQDVWFKQDGSYPEMRKLAEAIAALM